MKLEVPLFKQPKKSFLCGPYCLKMLYSYYGRTREIKDILSEIKFYRKGTNTSELGISLLKNGFDVTIYCLNSRNFPNEFKKMNSKEILAELKKIIRPILGIRFRRSMIRFLEEGGEFKSRITTIEDIKKAIESKSPPILTIERKSLYGDKIGDSGHFVIASGFDNKNIIINDPNHTYGGIKPYTYDEIRFALYSWRGSVLFAKPKC